MIPGPDRLIRCARGGVGVLHYMGVGVTFPHPETRTAAAKTLGKVHKKNRYALRFAA